MRPPPKNLDTPLTFENSIGMGICEIPCLTNFEQGVKKGKTIIAKRLKVALIWSSQIIQRTLMYMPDLSNRGLVGMLSETGQMGVSNIQGMKREISVGGYDLKDSHFITPNVLKIGVTFLGFTYNGKFKYALYQDTAMEAKPEKIVEHIEKVIQEEIEKSN